MLDLLMGILHSPVHPASSAAEEDLIGPSTHQKLKGNDNEREKRICERLREKRGVRDYASAWGGLRGVRHSH
jgi:hypothetical protein